MKINLKTYQAVIFDMDGVLIDSEPLWKIALEEVFQSLGSTLTKSDFQKTVGLRIDEVVDYWYKHQGWKNTTAKEIEIKIINKVEELIRQRGKPLSGVKELLEFLKKNQIKIGLATSSYKQLMNAVLEVLKIEEYFDFAHSAEFETYGKPHPAVYLSVAEKLMVSHHHCLVIEDSLNGIISAKAARMNVVCIPEKTHHPEPRLNLADFQFENLMEFLDHQKEFIEI